VSGYAAWMDATQFDKFTYSSSNVISQWTDATGTYNATQSTVANQPTRVTNAINGKPAVRFDGVNDFLNWNLSSLSSHTIFMVLRFPSTITAANDTQELLVRDVTGRTNGFIAFGDVSGSFSNERLTWVTVFCPAGINYSGGDFAAGSHQFTWRFNISGYAGTMKYDKSTLTTSTTPGCGGFSATDYPSNYATLGAGGGGVAPFVGDIGEIIVYTSALSDSNITSVENYLATKWGL
jgi:hypothetical protein